MPAQTITLAPNYRDALTDALAEMTGTRAAIIGTGGGCEALIVGPLDNGTHLWLTDDNLGVPVHGADSGPEWDAGDARTGWLVNVAPHGPDVECDRCGDCVMEGPFVHDPDASWSVDGAVSVVRRALTGDYTGTCCLTWS